MSAKTSQRIWTVEQLEFIEWLALPKRIREPKTQKLFAHQIGVDEGTLSDWKRLSGFLDAVTAKSREYLKSEIPDIFGALVAEAKSGDVPAIKLVAQLTDQLIERSDITSGGETFQLQWPKVNDDDTD